MKNFSLKLKINIQHLVNLNIFKKSLNIIISNSRYETLIILMTLLLLWLRSEYGRNVHRKFSKVGETCMNLDLLYFK